MDAVLNDSAMLTYDDTKSLRVRIKTLSKKSLPSSLADSEAPMLMNLVVEERNMFHLYLF